MKRGNLRKFLLFPKLKAFLSLVSIAYLVYPASSFSNELDPILQEPLQRREIPRAIEIQMTAKGEKLFGENISYVLGNMGAFFDRGNFESREFAPDKPIPWEKLPVPDDIRRLIVTMKSFLTEYVEGFSLVDPLPTLKLGDSHFQIDLKRFALVAEPQILQQLGKNSGAVFTLELSLRRLEFHAESLRAYDKSNQKNPLLKKLIQGELGADDLNLRLENSKDPITLRMPFYVSISPQGLLVFEALNVEENFDKMNLQMAYKKLLIPSFDFQGQIIRIRRQKVDNLVQKNFPSVAAQLKKLLGGWIEKQMIPFLNQASKDYFINKMEQVRTMAPAKAPSVDVTPFYWSLTLQPPQQKPRTHILLSSAIEEPANLEKEILSKSKRTTDSYFPDFGLPEHCPTEAPRGQAYPEDQYHFWMSLNSCVINRVIQLSYNRKYLSQFQLESGLKLQILEPPEVFPYGTASNHPFQTSGKMRLKIRYPYQREGAIETLFVEDHFVLSFDIFLNFDYDPVRNKVLMKVSGVDKNSFVIHQGIKYKGLSMVKERVFTKVRKILQGHDERIQKSKSSLILAELPFPPQAFGLHFHLIKIDFEPTGHLVMYLNSPRLGGTN